MDKHQNESLERTQNGDSKAALSNDGVKIETEEEEFEEIIDDEADEAEGDEAKKGPAANKENACYGLGSLEQPFVKFYFTSPCPELGLDKVC